MNMADVGRHFSADPFFLVIIQVNIICKCQNLILIFAPITYALDWLSKRGLAITFDHLPAISPSVRDSNTLTQHSAHYFVAHTQMRNQLSTVATNQPWWRTSIAAGDGNFLLLVRISSWKFFERFPLPSFIIWRFFIAQPTLLVIMSYTAGSIVHIIEKKRKEISPSCFRS